MTTRDGEPTLPRVLRAYCDVEPPPGGWKLLVVDNGSTDATRDILNSFSGRLPLEYLFEARRGQNFSRNKGLPKLAGDLAVFADDDAIPRRDWLLQLRSAADEHPEFAIFGGTILPQWEREPEDWLLRWVPLSVGFALTDPQWEEGPIRTSWVFSPNMAIRASIFREGYRFNEDFGPRAGSYAMGSETELTQRLASAGCRAWHVKNAVVQHIIRPFQVTPDWILSRAVRYGRGKYRLAAEGKALPRTFFGVAAGPLRGILSHAGRLAVAKCLGDPRAVFHWRWSLRCSIGSMLEARALHRQRRSGGASQGAVR